MVVYRKFMVRVTNSKFSLVISMAKENPALPKSGNFIPEDSDTIVWGVENILAISHSSIQSLTL